MFTFSDSSRKRLETCHSDLIILCNDAIKVFDFTVLQGYRTPAQHAEYLERGTTTIPYEKSRHSTNPSTAVDLVPYHAEKPHIRWDDLDAFRYLAGVMMGCAASRNIGLEWGGHWDNFVDMPHFQLKK